MLLGRGRAARRRGLPRVRDCRISVTLGLSYQVLACGVQIPILPLMGREPGAFAAFVARNHQRICVAAADSDDVSKLLVIGYKMGISRGDAACMNDLGALYYMG